MELEDLKNGYATAAKKHGLPSFNELNTNFEIEKIERESDMLVRTIRKTMMDKIVNSMGFVEMLMNPMNAPRMYVPFVKSMNGEDMKKLEKLHSVLSELIIGSLELEVNYDEKKDALLIKKINSQWKGVKEDFGKLFESIRKPAVNFVKKERSYFG